MFRLHIALSQTGLAGRPEKQSSPLPPISLHPNPARLVTPALSVSGARTLAHPSAKRIQAFAVRV